MMCQVGHLATPLSFTVIGVPTYIPSCKTEAYIPLESKNNTSIVTCALVL